MTILNEIKAGRLVVVPPVSVKLTPCDCERGHNGIGLSGRECDCAPDHTTALLSLVEGMERERDEAQRLVNQLSDDITFLRKRRGDLVRARDAAEARALAAPPATPSPAQVAETGWLIELKGVTPSWAIVNPNDYDEHWTTDSTRALRFARKVDAEAYIAHIGWTEAFASEHVWDDGRRSGYSDRSTADYLDKRLQEARDRSPDYEKLWAEEAERAEAAQEEIETLKALICRIEPYVDAIVCYASTMGEHEPNCIAHEVRAVCHGPSQDELVGRQIAAQMLVKIDAAASPPALAARSTEAWRDLDNARLQRAIDAFYEPCEGTTIDGIRNAILAWERG